LSERNTALKGDFLGDWTSEDAIADREFWRSLRSRFGLGNWGRRGRGLLLGNLFLLWKRLF